MRKFAAASVLLLAVLGCAAKEQYISAEARKYVEQGNRLLREEHRQEAIAAYLRAIAAEPHYGSAYLNLGQAYEAGAEYERALLAYDRAIESRKNDEAAWLRRGSVRYELEEYEGAEQDLRRAISLFKEHAPPEAYNTLGLALAAQGRYLSAVEQYWNAAERGSENPFIYNNLGIAYTRAGKVLPAEECYQKAVELDPSFADAHYNLAKFYINVSKDKAKALLHCQRYKEAGGTRPEVDKWMAELIHK